MTESRKAAKRESECDVVSCGSVPRGLRMARFKPDASFFRKIVIGANGTRAICEDLRRYGHDVVELERGSTTVKLWKDVKRKRVRIPDLICLRCGRRVESRAKTKAELSMSHSDSDQERSWDYGMLSEDWIAFPISASTKSETWTKGLLRGNAAYWHERDWSEWATAGRINYLTVGAFRDIAPDTSRRKGVTEGSELTLTWNAKFATCCGRVEAIEDGRVKIRPSEGRVRTLRFLPRLNVHISVGESVQENQILCSGPVPISEETLRCPGRLANGHIKDCLASRERTVRFSAVKISRICGIKENAQAIEEMAQDSEEDLYVRLESLAYLASVGGIGVGELFDEYLQSSDPQIRLEAVITVGEVGTSEAIEMLGRILHGRGIEYFLRSAAAWSLGKIGTGEAQEQLKQAFADVSYDIREEALDALVAVGESALPVLLPGVQETNDNVAAGCAEVIRQISCGRVSAFGQLTERLRQPDVPKWLVWLVGHMSAEEASEFAGQADSLNPEVSYAISLLWSFTRSWIARRWEIQRGVSTTTLLGVLPPRITS